MIDNSLNPCVIVAKKNDKKSILRFYKDNHYPARFIGLDRCYLLKVDNNIIASVIISQGNKSQQLDPSIASNSELNLQQSKVPYFLHALLVTPKYQRLGYGEYLLKHVMMKHQPLICFAQESLSQLYLNNGFTNITGNVFNQCLPPDLINRFQRYSKKKPDLKAFICHCLV